MSNIFQKNHLVLRSGEPADFKIECDALTDEDIEAIAYIISKKILFSATFGIPRGGEKLAKALEQYQSDKGPLLIVDDVCTTGGSLIAAREEMLKYTEDIIGVCIFARRAEHLPDWVSAVFTMWGY